MRLKHQTPSIVRASVGARAQGGVLLLEAMLYLLIASLATIYLSAYTLKTIEDSGMDSTATYMKILKTGLEKYNLTNRDQLAIAGVIRQPACGTVAGRTGAFLGNALAPTVQELIDGQCIAAPGFRTTTPQNIGVNTRIERTNCPGLSCSLFAVAFTTAGITTGNSNGDPRYDLVARYLQSTEGSGAASQYGNEARLRSAYFNVANTVTLSGGAPAGGVLAIGTYFDEGLYGNFVRMGETRSVTLNNTLTVVATMGTNDGLAGCLRAALTADGQILARASDCMTRVALDGNNGSVSTFDTTGRNAAGIRYAGNTSTVYADNLQNNNNTGGIRDDGTVFGTAVNISGSAAAGGACTNENDIVRSGGTNSSLLLCRSGQWRLIGGLQEGTVNAVCNPEGAPGISTAGVGLICQGGRWMSNTSRFGRFAATDNYENVVHNTQIAKPICGSAGRPIIYLMPQGVATAAYPLSATSTSYVANFRIREDPTVYTILIDDTQGYNVAAGSATDSYGLAIAGCYYNS
jgi:hypothetical protein